MCRIRKKYLILLIVIPALLISIVLGFLIWAQIYYRPTERALDYLNSDDKVDVEVAGNIRFSPTLCDRSKAALEVTLIPY